MNTIGIVGGIAWLSSFVYYRAINEVYKQRTSTTGLHTPSLILAQGDFALIENAQTKGNWDEVGRLLVNEIKKLKASGADFFLLAYNTVHMAQDYILRNIDLPMLHIVDAAATKVREGGYKTVGLLGSRYTMTGTYFVGRLQEMYGLTILVAQGEHETNVHNALYQELARSVFLSETRQPFKAAMADLVYRGAQVVILGCTEFGVLVKAEDSPVPIIDTSLAHAEAAIDFALSDEPITEPC